MDRDVKFVATQIMKWFKDTNSSPGYIMSDSHLHSLSCKSPIWNSEQRQAISAAIEYLVNQGFITANENDYIRLAQRGYDELHKMSHTEIITALLEEYQKGNAHNISPSDFGLDRLALLEIIDTMEQGGLIKGAAIVRGGQGNKVISGWIERARITLQGIDYLNGGRYHMSSQTSNTYHIENSTVTGSQIGTINSQLNINSADFSNEVNQAISEIKNISQLTTDNMNTIIELLGEINAAVQSDDTETQTEKKFTLKGLLKGLGNAGVKVISVLSSLANLAKFLGY